jgi:hypothetical protein
VPSPTEPAFAQKISTRIEGKEIEIKGIYEKKPQNADNAIPCNDRMPQKRKKRSEKYEQILPTKREGKRM